jgi:hypothetical protein
MMEKAKDPETRLVLDLILGRALRLEKRREKLPN